MAKKKTFGVDINDAMNYISANETGSFQDRHESRLAMQNTEEKKVDETVIEPKRKAPRKNATALTKRPNKMTVLLDDETKSTIDMLKYKNKIDFQDFGFAALKYFIKRYVTETDGITPEGKKIMEDYLG